MTTAAFLGLDIPARSAKPREQGLTMVMDQGWSVEFTAGMLDQFGEFLDIAKLWDPLLLAPADVVRKKIQAYRDHDVHVQPGGLYIEIARKQAREQEVLKKLAELGCDTIEVSSTTSTRSDMSDEMEFVSYAKSLGFSVIGEVGRKFSDGDETRLTEDTLNVEVTVGEFKSLLQAGASKVYWEGHLLREVMGETPDAIKERAGSGTAQVLEVARQVGTENIMFEVSGLRPRMNRQWLQFWLVRLFGPDVNIGNARIEEMANLEAIRRGNHPIFGFGSSGNYPWVRSLESGNGTGDWWRT
ncbi:MAG: phosphosulfolactate synthase [Candidatus Dormibacteraceae bacterium]